MIGEGKGWLMRCGVLLLVLFVGSPGPVVAGSVRGMDEASGQIAAAMLRQPVDAVAIGDGRVVVANRRSGSLAVIDPAAGRVLGESRVGAGPVSVADLGRTGDVSHLLVCDERAGGLILVEVAGNEIRVVSRREIAGDPQQVRVSPSGHVAAVASRWSRTLALLEVPSRDENGTFPPFARWSAETLPLPYAPRELLWLPGGNHLLVADAFGGRLAVVDGAGGRVVRSVELPGHNIGGLALSADGASVSVSHQILNPLASTTFDDVHWGLLMSNVVRRLPVAGLIDPSADPLADAGVIRLGFVGDGAGDPAGLTLDRHGRTFVALGGVNQLGVVDRDGTVTQTIDVGRRPQRVLLAEDQRVAVTIDTLGDSLSVVDTRSLEVVRTIRLSDSPQLTPADRGERLFFDARLSQGGWLSCHSCHTDGHSNGLLADTLGDGGYGNPKRVPSLLGTRDAGPWAWNGSMKELHDQVHQSVVRTMHGRALRGSEVNDMVAYLHSLSAAPPREPRPAESDTSAVAAEARALVDRGEELFGSLGCANCHVPPLTFTTEGTFDVGLRDEKGLEKFNPPSLRGVSQRGKLFHDGRAGSLEEVIGRFGHQVERDLSREERAALLRYLRSL